MVKRTQMNRLTANDLEWEILAAIRGKAAVDPFIQAEAFYMVYQLSLRKEFDWYGEEALAEVIGLCRRKGFNELPDFISHESKIGNELLKLSKGVEPKVVKGLLLHFEDNLTIGGKAYGESGTSDSLSHLALSILKIGKRERVADFCSGIGGFLTMVYEQVPGAVLKGYDIMRSACQIFRIRADVLLDPPNMKELITAYKGQPDMLDQYLDKYHQKIAIENRDILQDMTPPGVENTAEHFDKIFCDHPLAMRFSARDSWIQSLPFAKKSKTLDWAFAAGVMQRLAKKGKAVVTLTNSCAWNFPEKAAREYFIRQGWVESVISLPVKMFSYTNISVLLLVLSHGNKEVHFVDASDIYEKGRRTNQFSKANIDTILKALAEDTDISKTVSNEEIEKKDFSVFPKTYLTPEDELESLSNYGTLIPLEDLTLRISRGAPIMASQLDAFSSEEDTGIDYLTLADMQDGLIQKDLKHMTEIPEGYGKYLIEDGSIILSKVGRPAKVGLASVPEGRQLMATGNMFVLELDKKKINPYYLLAFLDSPEGNVLMNLFYVGMTVPSIRIQSLKEIKIPVPPMERQQQVAEIYKKCQDDLYKAKDALRKMIQAKTKVFDDTMKEE